VSGGEKGEEGRLKMRFTDQSPFYLSPLTRPDNCSSTPVLPYGSPRKESSIGSRLALTKSKNKFS